MIDCDAPEADYIRESAIRQPLVNRSASEDETASFSRLYVRNPAVGVTQKRLISDRFRNTRTGVRKEMVCDNPCRLISAG